ncbi:MAG: hypothetical protein IIC79_02810 [Chloroflexi bacterium]|nr:hypothetical protein [Chloroflexota bacterium]
MNKTIEAPSKNGKIRRRFGVGITLTGFLIFLLGADPNMFGLDRTDVIGFVQIMVFLSGLGVLCLGGLILYQVSWAGIQKTIPAEIGLRLVATGYVIALASGMADVFGLGTRPLPNVPFFGYWQARGVLLGEIVIMIGFALMIPFVRRSE